MILIPSTHIQAYDPVMDIAVAPDGGKNTKATTQNDGDACFPLFDLPPELWSNICKLATVKAETEPPIFDSRLPGAKAMERYVSQPNITRTCKAIRQEVIQYFYEQTTLIFRDEWECPTAFDKWLTSIGAVRARLIKHVYFISSFPDILPIFRNYLVGWSCKHGDGDGNANGERICRHGQECHVGKERIRIKASEVTADDISPIEVDEESEVWKLEIVIECDP